MDISADVLFTDLAPWLSLVQRFGRCTRNGTAKDFRILWLKNVQRKDRPLVFAGGADEGAIRAQRTFQRLSGASARPDADLPEHVVPYVPDLFDLFDTTPDLAGAAIAVSLYIRKSDDTDAQVFAVLSGAVSRMMVFLQKFLQKKHGIFFRHTGRRIEQRARSSFRHGASASQVRRRLSAGYGMVSRFPRPCFSC